MKRSVLILSSIIAFSLLCSTTCEEEGGWTSAKGIETLIFQEIKDYRTESSLDGPFVHQLVMVKEAQQYSYRMASGQIPFDITNIGSQWDIILDKLVMTNPTTIIQKSTSQSESDIVDFWKNDSLANSILLGNFTQCGVGLEFDTANVAYITVLLAHAESY